MINGEPAEGARLVFHPADGKPFDARGTRPTAKVDADGAFQVTTYQNGDGIPVGDYQVAILWFANPNSSNSWDKLGNRYANPERTGIRISIKEGANQLEPIRLDGVRVLMRQPRRNSPDHDQID